MAGVLAAEGLQTERERKLNLLVTVLLIIMINIYTTDSIGAVLEKIAQGLRYIWPDPDYEVANASAISYRRYQVGARPMVALFQEVCQPMASPDTPGAFMFGLRLMALDGTTEDVPDTAANAAVFGRHQSDRRCRGSTWSSAAPTPLSTLVSGPITPANGLVAFDYYAQSSLVCC